MFKVGDRVHWHDDFTLVGVVTGVGNFKYTVDGGVHGIQDNFHESHLRLIDSSTSTITIAINTKPTWKDLDDSSTFQDIAPGINAAVAYAADGSCWEWAVGAHRDAAVGQGRSIDRVTAKADAEFFASNYTAEDTSEREDIRRRLNKNWGYTP